MVSAPVWLVERELSTLRRNVEQELVTGLRDQLHKIFVETFLTFPNIVAFPDIQHPSSRPSLRVAASGTGDAEDAGVIPPIPNVVDDRSVPYSLYSEEETRKKHQDVMDRQSSDQSSNRAVTFKRPSVISEVVPRHLLEDDPEEKPVFISEPPPKPRGSAASLKVDSSHTEEDDSDSDAGPEIMSMMSISQAGFAKMARLVSTSTKVVAKDSSGRRLGSEGSSDGKREGEGVQSEDSEVEKKTMREARAGAMTGTLSVKGIAGGILFESKQNNSMIAKAVKHDYFDYGMSVILIINSFCIGLRVDWEASNLNADDLDVYIWMDRMFCVIFMSELFLRLYTWKLNFYFMSGWQWAYFDTVIVAFQFVEEVMLIIQGQASINLGFLKMLKMGRLARMVRMVRLLPELKSLVLLIMASMSSFVWTCVLLMLLVYMLSIYMVMMAVESLEKGPADTERRELLQEYWGSVGSAVLSLYWSITGGQDWAVVIGPLVEETESQIHNIIFSMFIAFATMVLMNLVTGVFVEGAARLTKEDRDKELSRMAHKVFRLVDDDNSEEISKQEFYRHMQSGGMDSYLQAVELPRSAAATLFEILDNDKSNSINVNEFVEGCLRLRGLPRAADVAQLLMEFRKNSQRQKDWFTALTRILEKLRQEVRRPSKQNAVKPIAMADANFDEV